MKTPTRVAASYKKRTLHKADRHTWSYKRKASGTNKRVTNGAANYEETKPTHIKLTPTTNVAANYKKNAVLTNYKKTPRAFVRHTKRIQCHLDGITLSNAAPPSPQM